MDLLIGAVNVWCWERDALAMLQEMQAKGIDRILWSNRQGPEVIQAMNQSRGVLTSRYDIYQDLMDPNVVKEQLRGVHPDWTQNAWPADIMRDENGDWRKGWQVRGKDGKMYPCAVLCDQQALKYAAERVPAELKTSPTAAASSTRRPPPRGASATIPTHPMTRSESRHWKMELLRYMSQDMHLVTGSETGHDAAVPFVHYFEGMLSLGPYRVPDSGRHMQRIWDEVPQHVAKFQTRPPLPPAAVGTGLSRLRGGPVVLGRLQQQAAGPVDQARPVQRPLRHAAHVHVHPQLLGAEQGPLRARATRTPARLCGPWVTPK